MAVTLRPSARQARTSRALAMRFLLAILAQVDARQYHCDLAVKKGLIEVRYLSSKITDKEASSIEITLGSQLHSLYIFCAPL